MNSEEAERRIALHVRLDLLIDVIDDEGMVWCEDEPYALLPEKMLPVSNLGEEVLYVALCTALFAFIGLIAVLVIVVYFVYALLGVLLWVMVSSVS